MCVVSMCEGEEAVRFSFLSCGERRVKWDYGNYNGGRDYSRSYVAAHLEEILEGFENCFLL